MTEGNSSYILLARQVIGKKLKITALKRMLKSVDKEDYSKRDIPRLLKHLSQLSNGLK